MDDGNWFHIVRAVLIEMAEHFSLSVICILATPHGGPSALRQHVTFL
jgi:hypothetical protein